MSGSGKTDLDTPTGKRRQDMKNPEKNGTRKRLLAAALVTVLLVSQTTVAIYAEPDEGTTYLNVREMLPMEKAQRG